MLKLKYLSNIDLKCNDESGILNKVRYGYTHFSNTYCSKDGFIRLMLGLRI